jgi:hypothetical protein
MLEAKKELTAWGTRAAALKGVAAVIFIDCHSRARETIDLSFTTTRDSLENTHW